MRPVTSTATERTYTLPVRLEGTCQPLLLLSGVWDFKYSPKSHWTSIQVSGEVAMQGFAIEHDKLPFPQKNIMIPADYAGKRVILRFDGVV